MPETGLDCVAEMLPAATILRASILPRAGNETHIKADFLPTPSEQVFPVTLDIENPKFLEGLERLRKIDVANLVLRDQTGVGVTLKRAAHAVQAVIAFGRLYFMREKSNPLPAEIRLQPTW